MNVTRSYFVVMTLLAAGGLAMAETNTVVQSAPAGPLPPTQNPVGASESRILSEQSIDNVDVDQVTALLLLSRLLTLNEAEVDVNLKMLYSELRHQGAVTLPAEMAKYAILLKALVPSLCQGNSAVGKDGKAMSIVDVTTAHISGLAQSNEVSGLSINSDLARYDSEHTVALTKPLFPLLILSKLACEAMQRSTSQLSEVEGVLNRAGYPLGSLVVMDPNNPAINELRTLVTSPFAQTAAEPQPAETAEEEASKHGYIEVEEGRIVDLNEVYPKIKHVLKSAEEVIKELAFRPSEPINTGGFHFLGAEGADVATPSGYTGLSAFYDSPLGKVAVAENDLVVSQGVTFVEPDAFNTAVGQHPAILTVYKTKESGIYSTELYWYNAANSREYTVEVSLDLNDPSQADNRQRLLDVLNQHFGAPQ